MSDWNSSCTRSSTRLVAQGASTRAEPSLSTLQARRRIRRSCRRASPQLSSAPASYCSPIARRTPGQMGIEPTTRFGLRCGFSVRRDGSSAITRALLQLLRGEPCGLHRASQGEPRPPRAPCRGGKSLPLAHRALGHHVVVSGGRCTRPLVQSPMLAYMARLPIQMLLLIPGGAVFEISRWCCLASHATMRLHGARSAPAARAGEHHRQLTSRCLGDHGQDRRTGKQM